MAGQEPGGRRTDRFQGGEAPVDDRAQPGRLPRGGQIVEVEGRVHLVGPHVTAQPLGTPYDRLGDEQPVLRVAVPERPPPAEDVVDAVDVPVRTVLPGARLEARPGTVPGV